MPWETVSQTFMKGDGTTSYGPGDFRIRGDHMISMKLAKPRITFKKPSHEDLENPQFVPQETEAWMKDADERANRRTVTLYAGTLTSATVTFHQYAQNAAWWLGPDWRVIYVATDWMDRTAESTIDKGRYKPVTTKLWKSTDQGQHWKQMKWPADQEIGFLHFLDAERGYAIGWGPHIWRTQNGGTSWQSIDVPANAKDPKDSRKAFDLVALGKNHTLYAAFSTYLNPTQNCQVWMLPWGQTRLKHAFDVPGIEVFNMLADQQGHVYVLAASGTKYKNDDQVTTLYRWDGEHLQKLHAFQKGKAGYAIHLTPDHHLLVQGPDYASLIPKDWSALSTDGGKTWKIDEGPSAQGGYYDPQTGTDWQVVGYTLSKRMIP